MAKKIFLAILLVTLLFPGNHLWATDFSSPSFIVKDPVIKPGAGFATSTSFELWSSFGQEAIGLSTSTAFGLKGGFLYFPLPTSAAPPPAVPVTPAAGGGGGGLIRIPLPAAEEAPPGLICDFNNDNRCDIVDFSIILVYFARPITAATTRYDLNKDGRIGFVDLSILFFYWG